MSIPLWVERPAPQPDKQKKDFSSKDFTDIV